MLARLLALVFPPREDEQTVTALDEAAFLALLAPEVVAETDPAAVALLPFTDVRVRAAVHEAKYHGSPRAFRFLARALADYLQSYSEEMRLTGAVLVPLPLGAQRKRERGFNQVEEVLKLVGRELQMPVDTTLLVRTRETASQVSLPRVERKRNMRGAFGAAHSLNPGQIYIIVDDVLTTGATLQAALTALTQAGATRLVPIALAH